MRSLVLIAGLSLALPAAADECVAPADMAQAQGVRAFEQVRTLDGVPRPLVSSGEVDLSPEKIVWRVTSPIEIATTISAGGMTQSINGGPETPVGASGAANPLLSDSGLVDLIKGDLSRVDELYDVVETASEKGWSLSLTPKADDMARFVAGVDVEGCTAVTAIIVRQTNGDQISVSFTD